MKKREPGQLKSTVPMAAVDAMPVVFFSISAVFVALIYKSVLFGIGATLCILGGAGKVLWKLIKAINGRDIRILFNGLRVLMPTGFVLIIISLFTDGADLGAVWKSITGFPCVIFFAIGCVCMTAMIILAFALDPANSRSNWIEQIVNTIAQLCFLLGIMIIWYSSDSYQATEEAYACMAGSDIVSVSETKFGLFFDGPGTENALIFYPGGKVEYTAYSPLMLLMAEDGTDCFLCEMPYDLAVFNINAAKKVTDRYTYKKWFIGGHSLGGAMASVYAEGDADISGVVLLGAYPTSEPSHPTLMVYGSNDEVIDPQKLEQGFAMGNVMGIAIEGGNHANFGCYEVQEGDGESKLTPEEQWYSTKKIVNEFISALDK